MEKELLDDATDRMAKAVAATRTEFNTVRSGRASTALLDRIHIDYYGRSRRSSRWPRSRPPSRA